MVHKLQCAKACFLSPNSKHDRKAGDKCNDTVNQDCSICIKVGFVSSASQLEFL